MRVILVEQNRKLSLKKNTFCPFWAHKFLTYRQTFLCFTHSQRSVIPTTCTVLTASFSVPTQGTSLPSHRDACVAKSAIFQKLLEVKSSSFIYNFCWGGESSSEKWWDKQSGVLKSGKGEWKGELLSIKASTFWGLRGCGSWFNKIYRYSLWGSYAWKIHRAEINEIIKPFKIF